MRRTAVAAILTEVELEQIRQAAREDYPRETCGFVLRHPTLVESIVFRCRNVMDELYAENPTRYPRTAELAYAIGPADLGRLDHARRQGAIVYAVYHSHTQHEGANFSDDDVTGALVDGAPRYPEAAQIVVSLPGGLFDSANAYRWDPQGRRYVLAGTLRWTRRLDPVRGAVLVATQPSVLPLVTRALTT